MNNLLRIPNFTSIRIIAFLFLSALLNQSEAQTIQTFNASGIFTMPTAAGVTSVTVQAWGGGGGGGTGAGRNRGGGGGGAYASSVLTLTPGNNYTVTVGNAGGPGANGGNSSFNTNSVIAAGGNGSATLSGGAGGTIFASTGTVRWPGGNGGTASNGNNDAGAGGGGSAFTTSAGLAGGNNVTGTPGVGGNGTGAGGNGGANTQNGLSGSLPGGGGGGRGDGASTSGAGATGRVVVSYTCPTYGTTAISASTICAANSSIITLTGTASALPTGNYIITYNLGAPNAATGLTVNVNVTTAGTATFSTPVLNNAGTTSITITNISSGPCNVAQVSGNTTNIIVRPMPLVTISGPSTVCMNGNALITFTNPQSLPVSATYTINSGANTTINIAANSSSTLAVNTSSVATFNYTLVSAAYQAAPTCSNTISGTVITTVTALPNIYTVTGGGDFCNGGSGVLIGLNGSEAGFSYQLLRNAIPIPILPAAGTGFALDFGLFNNAGTYTVVATNNTTGCQINMSGSALININARPTASISGTATICSGSSTTLIIAVTGSGTLSGTLSDGTLFSGTAPLITINVSPVATTIYSVATLTDALCAAIPADLSGSATITVNQPVVITTQPVITQTVCKNSNASLSVAATGTGLTYQWYKGITPLSNGGRISGVNTPTLNINSVVPADAAADYKVLVSGTTPCTALMSDNSQLIISQEIFFTTQPLATQTVCSGSSATISATATGNGPFQYQWYFGNTPVNTGVSEVSNATSITTTLQINPVGSGDAGNYYVTISSTGGTCAAEISNISVLNVQLPSTDPTSASASSTTICSGQNTTLILNGGGGGTGETIRWFTSSCGGTLLGTGNNLVVNPTSTTTYYGRYETPAPCSLNTSCASVTITVNNIPANPTSVTASASTICAGQSTTLTLNGGGGGTGELIRWYTSSCGGTLAGTGNNLSVSPSTTTTYFGRYETTAPCAVNSACASTTITVNTIPTDPVSATASSTTICNGQSTILTLNGGGGGTGSVIRWYTASCGGTLVGTGNNLSVSPTTATTYYGRYETNAPCSFNTICSSVSINVNQLPANPVSASASSTTICSGQNTTLILNGGGGGTGEIIRWYTTSCGGSLAGTGNNFTVSPGTTTTYFGRYETAAPCSINSACASVTITVNTIPANPVSATASATTICNGQSTTLTLNGGGGGTGSIINWYSTSCGGTLVGTGNNLSVSPTTTTTYYGRYETTAPCSTNSSCASVTITVNYAPANPTSATASSTTICNGQTVTLILNGGGGGTGQVIRWYTTSCGGTLAGTGNNLSVSPITTTTYFGRYETAAPCLINSLCASVTITVNQSAVNPVSASATPAAICIGSSSTLSISGGSAGTGGIIRWYTSSCGGTLAGTGNNLSVSPATTTTYFGRYETTAPCSSNTICVSTTVIVNQLATANAGSNISLCGDASQATPSGATSINVTTGATATNYSFVTWSTSGTGTFANANSLTLATYTPSTADKNAGSVTLTLTAVGISPCANAVSTKVLTLGKTIVNDVQLTSICSAGNTVVVVISQGSLPVTGGNGTYSYQWQFSTPGNSNFVNIPGETNPSLSVTQPSNNGFYRRIITSGGCTSYSARIHVNASNVLLSSSFSVTGGGAYCSGGAGVPVGLTNSIDGLPEFFVMYNLYRDGVYTGVSVQGTGAAFNFPNQTVAGTYTVQAVVSVVNGGTCSPQNVSGSVIISIDAPIPAVSVGGNQNLCNVFGATITGSDPAPYSGVWTRISGSGTIVTPAASTTNVTGLAIGDNIFQWKVANGTCRDSARVTIKVDPQLAFTQQPVSVTYCPGENVNFSVAVTGSLPVYAWKISTDGGVTYNNLVNDAFHSGAGTATLSITAPTLAMSGNLYQLLVTVGAPCNTSILSVPVSLYIKNQWIGNISADWNNPANWSGNATPSTICANVYVPAGRPFNPVLSSGMSEIQNLIIDATASVTVDNATLKIAGVITNNGTFNAIKGHLEFNGTSPQTIAANTFFNNGLNDLTISNTAGTLTLGGALNVFGRVSFTGTGKTFVTNDYLTLRSTLNGTSSIAEITVDGAGNALNDITGKVTVERYISALRAWRFLSIPTNTTQTIKQSWQENQPTNSTSLNGFGIHITSERPTWLTDGFDLYTPNGGTMKTYLPATDTWKSINSTLSPIATTDGYMVLVRGDRTVNAFGQAPKPTLLRTSGNLFMGKQTARAVPANQFTVMGNPYASAIDFSKIAKTGGVQDVFYVWDPKLAGLGAWQTFIGLGTSYFAVPGGGSYAGENTNIESGQAFLVRAVGTPGTITFEENNKVNGSFTVSRTSNQLSYLKTILKSGTSVIDGVVNIFDQNYSNAADKHDALKLVRTGETVSIKKDSKYLAAEQSQLTAENDSIQFSMGQLRRQTYQFEFTAQNIPANVSMIFIKDKYLGTVSQIESSGNSTYNFVVNADTRSSDADRFQIIFKYAMLSAVRITEISAKKKTANVTTINWKSSTESGVYFYTIERSVDGNAFESIGSVRAANNLVSNEYTFDDRNVSGTELRYRIKVNLADGNKIFSGIATVYYTTDNGQISIYPNPVVNKKINISFNNAIEKVYTISIINAEGKEIYSENSTTQSGAQKAIQLSSHMPAGNYTCIIIDKNGLRSVHSIVIL